jgi:MFS transporter, PAT family, beta-lactamase induction signal transducer AmpG
MTTELPQQSSAPGEAARAARRPVKQIGWVLSSYFGEGLPWTFLHQMTTEFLTTIRVSNTLVSSTSLLHFVISFKFLFSPIVDLFGTKRSWMIWLQIVLGLAMMVVAVIAPTGNMLAFWGAIVVLAVFHATHDIACDGFYLLALDQKGQALFSGVRTAAFRAATIVGSFGLVYLAARTGWLQGFGAAGVLMILVGLLNAVVLPRPPEPRPEARTAATKGRKEKGAHLRAHKEFFKQPQALLIISFMFFYRIGDVMMFSMSKPMLRDIGVETGQRAILNGLGIGVLIVASLLGGALLARDGLARWLIPITYFQNLAIPLYIALAVFKPPFGIVIPVVLVEQFAAGVGASAQAVFLMQRTRRAFSASHYAFATAIVATGSAVFGFLAGPINTLVGHPLFFTIAFVASWPGLILVLRVPRTPVEPAAAAGS